MTTELSDSTAAQTPVLSEDEKRVLELVREYHRRKKRTVGLSAETERLAATPAPYGKPGGPGLYGVKGQKHSDYFEQIVKAMMRNGKTKAEASRMAWGILRRWARGGGHVHPEVQAAAQRALAEEATKHGKGKSLANEAFGRVVELYGTTAGAAKHQRVPAGQPGGGQFTKGQNQQAKSKQQKIAGLRHALAAVTQKIVTSRLAIEADLKAMRASKAATRKATVGKSTKANAAKAAAATKGKTAQQASKQAAAKRSAKPSAPGPGANRLAADRARLASLIVMRNSIRRQLKGLGA